jgi:hypothetical protein
LRRAACNAVILGAVLAVVSPAAAQTDTLPDVEETDDEVVDTVKGTVDDTVDTVNSTGDAVAGVEDTTAGVTGSSGASGGTSGEGLGGTTDGVLGVAGTSSSNGSQTSNTRAVQAGKRYRSAFDRLPRRLETLLERIALGRNMRADLERLERLLASSSPRLRARVLRLLRAEIRRLRAGGVTRAERARIDRLQILRRTLAEGTSVSASASASGSSLSGWGWETATGYESRHAEASFGAAGDAVGPATQSKSGGGGGVLGAQVGPSDGDGEGGRLPIALPEVVDDFPFWLKVLLLALLGLSLAGLVATVTRHVRSG